MNSIKKSLILLAAATAFSCSDKQESSSSNDPDAKVFEKILTFYTNYIFGPQEASDSVIAMYCTKNLAQELSKAYDDEFSDGGGYAVWKFRSGAQDGEDIHEIEKIEPLGDGKYLVHYNDSGNKGSHTITIVQQNGDIFFDKLD